jgi:hypothetical protein
MIVAIYEKRQSIKRQVRWPYLRRGQMHRYQQFSMLDKHLLKIKHEKSYSDVY